MKKIFKITGIYLLLIILDFGCTPPEHVIINDIEFRSVTIKERKENHQYNSYVDTSVFKNEIVFAVTEKIVTVASLNLGLAEKCYATSLPETIYNNSILENTFSLKFNKDFTFRNQVISANQNLFEIKEIKDQISIFNNTNSIFNTTDINSVNNKIIEFNSDFINEGVFINEVYEVEFECKTSDNRVFNKKIEVKFRD
ncbi:MULTISPECIES: hypothetical protein [Flavobacterium]|uniref:Uncharacterized protein n=1 Tax=Flavobacterium salmonis TaxID=2654844 RepID=A0A6V6Z739_9FLAO|nr:MULTISPECIES: hypothetical protein [Flavobacterium]CAD0007598.1 hypothetical protein FLAT13_03923 [Flavobacterium salmonis]